MAFDAIVIGTGFGGTIAAVQLAANGKSVLLLERGTFWRSPDPIGLNVGDPSELGRSKTTCRSSIGPGLITERG